MKYSLLLATTLLLGTVQAEIIEFNNILTLKRSVAPVSSIAVFKRLIADKVFVEFYQPNCPPCATLARTLTRLSQEYPDVKIIKVDVSKLREFITRYNIRSTPTCMIFVNGSMEKRIAGNKSYSELKALIQEYLL